MQCISLTKAAHDLVREVLKPGDIAIDATIGNGHDTLFLVEQVSPSGKVFGFDIQQAAIDLTRIKIESHFRTSDKMSVNPPLTPECLTLIEASHANMGDNIPPQYHGKISAIMFNLGYLPGGDKRIITLTDSTVAALNSACRLLSSKGIITLIAYPGHHGGDLETFEVINWCEQLIDEHFSVSFFYSVKNNHSLPRLFVIRKQ